METNVQKTKETTKIRPDMLAPDIYSLSGFYAASEANNYDCAEWLPDSNRIFTQTGETYAALKVSVSDDLDKKKQKAVKKKLMEEFKNKETLRQRPQLSTTPEYAKPTASEQTKASVSLFDPYLCILRLLPHKSSDRYLDLLDVPFVVQRWREALLSNSDRLSDNVREALSGHNSAGGVSNKPHLAFVPLAHVGSEHANGHLMGMGLALPKNMSHGDRCIVFKHAGKISKLRLGRLGVWNIMPKPHEQPPWNLRAVVWTAHPKGATHWSTVTPIVYDRHPKTKNKAAYFAEVANMISEACLRIDLPEPREVIVTPVSAHLGVPPSHVFPRLMRKNKSEQRHTHAILVFREPVCGPILLGAGRYRGYGVLRPIEAEV